MKQAYLIAVLFFSLFYINLNAQPCVGNVTLNSQKDVDNFNCSSISGSLIINGLGSTDIKDLEPIFQGGLNSGAPVTGSVVVVGCHGLETLTGLRGIKEIGDGFRIVNNPNLKVIGEEEFELGIVKEDLMISNCPMLENSEALQNLEILGVFQLEGATSLEDFSHFNSLNECKGIEFKETTVKEINGFEGIGQTSYINIILNSQLEKITGFNNIEKISQSMILGATQNLMHIEDNGTLFDISGFDNLDSATGTSIIIRGNSKLEDCCFSTRIFNSNPGLAQINNNASGCNSVAEIDAPPVLGTCPLAQTVGTNAGDCEGSFSISHPSVSDNCDFQALGIRVTKAGSPLVENYTVTGQNSSSYTFIDGVYTMEFIARDANNNTTACTSTVTIEDDEAPVISGIPANVTINCGDNFPSTPNPTFSDNCDTDLTLTANGSITMGNCELGQPAEIQSFTWNATDDEGNSSSAAWSVTVISDFSFDLGGAISVCGQSSVALNPGNIGNTYAWSTGASTQSINVSSSGTYGVTVTTDNGCCYADDVQVTFESAPNASATGAELSCSATSVQIMGSSTSTGVTYAWTGPGGFTSSMQNPSVSAVGTYTLTVSKGAGCSSTATATVTADTDVPNASAQGGSITCAVASFQLMGSSTTSGVTYMWSGPGGYSSSMQNPTVSQAGTYTLTVSSGNGCSGMAMATVVDDSDGPSVDVQNGVINCNNPEIDYSESGDVSWSGPGGFSSTSNQITISSPGTYGITVTADNGCTASDNFTVSGNFEEPNISASGGALGCSVSQVSLSGSSTTSGVSYSWSGPGGFTSSSASPSVSSPGSYTLTVTGSNGCESSQTVEVTSGDDAPVLSSSGGIIDCEQTSLTLDVTSSQNNTTFQWSGPAGFTASGASVMVTEPGTYTISGTNADGCSGSTSVEVIDNVVIPEVEITAGELGCETSAVTFTTTTFSDVVAYAWTGPDGFTSDEKEPEVMTAGIYTLTSTGSNGCEATDEYEVTIDAEVPDASAEGGTLTCTENSTVINGSSASEGVSFLWEGPDGFTSTDQNPTVSVIGTYYFNVIAENGCVGIDSAMVVGDGDLPTISATGGTIDCNNESVMLIGSTTSEGVTVSWDGPNGFSTTDLTAEVDIPGFYTFTVSSSANCEVFSVVEVVLDNLDPDILLSQGAINCEAGTRVFNVSTNALDGDFSWTGPDGFTSEQTNPTYNQAGTYELTIVDDNGCSSTGQIVVQDDVNYEAELLISGNNVNLQITGGTQPFTVVFNNSINGTSATGLSNGQHFVSITDGLGCQQVIDFNINTTSTYEIINPEEITLKPNPVSEVLVLEWTGLENKISEVSIIDAAGRLILSRKVEGNRLVLNQLGGIDEGVYFIKLQGRRSLGVKRFIKL